MSGRLRGPSCRHSRPAAPKDVMLLIQDTTKRVGQHGVRGWWEELTNVYRLSVKHGLGLHKRTPGIVVRKRRGEVTIMQQSVHFAKFPANVDMPDACLHRDFDRWLAEMRKQLKSPIAKSGRGRFNGEFGETKFKAWRSTKIIEFANVLAWDAQRNPVARGRLSESTLGGWIKRHTPKDVNVTKKALEDALRCLPALFAQVEHEETQEAPDRELIAARIAKQIARKPSLIIRRIAGEET
jgi:hypothetical protein